MNCTRSALPNCSPSSLNKPPPGSSSTRRFAHLDSSSFHLDGSYNSGDDEPVDGVIQIKRGYSRDNRPDLNQVVLELSAENTAGLPLLMRPLSGNASDKTSFQEAVLRHAGQLQNAGVEVLVMAGTTGTPCKP